MMEIDWEVRPFEAEDAAEVRALLESSFETPLEADLAEALRADGDAEIEWVADSAEGVIGYIILSKMTAPVHALGLGPIATHTDYRKQGVAASLIESSLALATANGWTNVFLLGDPKFYGQFGFSSEKAAAFESAYPAPYWQVSVLDEDEAPTSGKAIYAGAFQRLT